MDTERNEVSCNYNNYSKPTNANTILIIDILYFEINSKFYYMFPNDNDQHCGLTHFVHYLTLSCPAVLICPAGQERVNKHKNKFAFTTMKVSL
jgi:hypothetical protein